jgi:alpha/beta superfamily hydrolase
MKPWIHSRNSVRRYGGKEEDYLPIHDWFDQTKAAYPDVKHRAILHHSFGIYICEQVFGTTLTNSDGKVISVRDVAEDHVKEDFGGVIPTIEHWLKNMETVNWMTGRGQKKFAEKENVYSD